VTESVYTLLIVESPVIAGIIQSVCPSSVYVLSTGGYCWRPEYDPAKNRLKAVADPQKTDIRRELKKQAQWANSIIIAADSDPAGDFITWSIAKFLNNPGLKRTRLQSLSKTGVYDMLDEARELDTSSLETRLRNRFMIRRQWKKSQIVPDFDLSGLAAIFGHAKTYCNFVNENGALFKSSSAIKLAPDEWISVAEDRSDLYYRPVKPLSTFDIIGKIVELRLTETYNNAQDLLHELFQIKLPFSGESLISYPRTPARAFYSETWEHIRRQYIKFGSQSELKPVFMQETADPGTPHESIHPVNLSLTPQHISGELQGSLGKLYYLIYHHTQSSITLPERISHAYINEFREGIHFFEGNGNVHGESRHSLRPVYTTSDLGTLLFELGICQPSGFGKNLDEWLARGWIHIENDLVTPGAPVIKKLNYAESLFNKLEKLNHLADSDSLDSETIRSIISSY
jgi:hypothetical protein